MGKRSSSTTVQNGNPRSSRNNAIQIKTRWWKHYFITVITGFPKDIVISTTATIWTGVIISCSLLLFLLPFQLQCLYGMFWMWNLQRKQLFGWQYLFIFLYARTWFIPEKRKMDLFKQLEKRYKDEPHKKLKGWLVAFYVVGTLVLYFVMLGIFVWK